jgi:hypothetical protein
MERLGRRLEIDEELRVRLHALDDSDKEIRRRYPAEWLAQSIRHRLGIKTPSPSSSIKRPGLGWHIPVIVATAAMVVLGLGLQFLIPLQLLPSWMGGNKAEETDRLKGGTLVLFRKTPTGSEVLGDGSGAHAGDQIRIGYRATTRFYGLILSVDGRGIVTRHFPQQGDQAAMLTTDGLVLLDHAYELDEAPGWECFYLVTGPKVFNVAPVLEAARMLGAGAGTRLPVALKLGAPLEQTSLVLIKGVTR